MPLLETDSVEDLCPQFSRQVSSTGMIQGVRKYTHMQLGDTFVSLEQGRFLTDTVILLLFSETGSLIQVSLGKKTGSSPAD